MHTATADSPVPHLLARMRVGADLARLEAPLDIVSAVAILPSFAVIDGHQRWLSWGPSGSVRRFSADGIRLPWTVSVPGSSEPLRGTIEVSATGTWSGEVPPGVDRPRAFSPHAQALASFAADAAVAQWELVQHLVPSLAAFARTYGDATYVALDTDAVVRRLRFGISWRSTPSPLGEALLELVSTDDLARSDVEEGVRAVVRDLVHRDIDQLVADADLTSVVARIRRTPAPHLSELVRLWEGANPGKQLRPAAFVDAIDRASPLAPELRASLADGVSGLWLGR